MQILILYAGVTTGHMRAAEAIYYFFKEKKNFKEIKLLDIADFYPTIKNFLRFLYINIMKYFPIIWFFLHSKGNLFKQYSLFIFIINKIADMMIKKINQEKIKYIISTHHFTTYLASRIKEKNNKNIKIIAVMTDFSINYFSINNNVDYYIVNNEDMVRDLLFLGVAASKIKIFGIPISFNFLEEKFNIEEEKKIFNMLIMGGGLGIDKNNTKKIIEEISELPVRISVVTGHNRLLKRQLQKHFSYNKNIKIYGYINNIDEVMRKADIILTKAGGVSLAESLAMGLCIIIINLLPGQEEKNAKYLLKKDAAIIIRNTAQLLPELKKLLKDNKRILELKNNAKKLAKPYSIYDIYNLINEDIENK